MRVLYTLCLLLLCMSASAHVVYKTIMADGTVVYSDIRSEGAVSVNLLSINTVVATALNNTASQLVNRNNAVTKRRPEVPYLVSIRYPEAEQTLRDNAGMVNIRADVSPKKAGRFQFVFDDQVIKTQSKGLFQLENVNRGAHIIQVNFLDNSGKILASSKQQTFYLHKASALINTN